MSSLRGLTLFGTALYQFMIFQAIKTAETRHFKVASIGSFQSLSSVSCPIQDFIGGGQVTEYVNCCFAIQSVSKTEQSLEGSITVARLIECG